MTKTRSRNSTAARRCGRASSDSASRRPVPPVRAPRAKAKAKKSRSSSSSSSSTAAAAAASSSSPPSSARKRSAAAISQQQQQQDHGTGGAATASSSSAGPAAEGGDAHESWSASAASSMTSSTTRNTPKPRPKPRPKPATRQLFDLIRQGKFDAASRRCATHPADASFHSKRSFHERYFDDNDSESYYLCGKNFTPLHMAMFKRAPDSLAESLMEAWPAACTAQSSGDTPLHLKTALCDAMPRSTLKLYVERFPPTLGCVQDATNLPTEIVRTVLSYVPTLGLIQNDMKRTVLHHVCGVARSLDSIKLLTHACPGAVSVPDRYGQLPLHYAIRKRNLPPSIARAFCSYGAPLDRPDKRGQTCLHVACLTLQSPALIRILLEHAPGAASSVEGFGFAPIHCYVIASGHEGRAPRGCRGVVEMLVRAAPDMLKVRLGGRLIRDIARRDYRLPRDIVDLLKVPQAASADGGGGDGEQEQDQEEQEQEQEQEPN